MLFLQMGVLLEEKTMFISPGKPQDWRIQAASVNFDLETAQKEGQVRLIWVPGGSPQNGVSDMQASRAIQDLVGLIRAEKPERVLINDFTPFLRFRSFDRFRQMFGWMIEQLAHADATVLLMMPDIINAQSQQIVEFIRNQMTGSIHVSMPEKEQEVSQEFSPESRRLVLWPGVGHVVHEVIDPWAIPLLSLSENQDAFSRSSAISADPDVEMSDKPGIFDATIGVPADASALSGSAPSVAVAALRDIEVLHASFFNKLKKSFKQRATKKYKPFLLVALRMEAEQTDGDDAIGLDMLLPAIEQIVVDTDDILVDKGRRRIIAFLPNKKDDNVQEFFESIQDKLREEYPSVADQLPHVVSAVVVPNGEPFENPEDFLAYALEGN